MNKVWYEIRITCGWKSGMSHPMDDEVVAKVKSEGLAQIFKLKLKDIYGEDAIIRIC